MVLQFASEERIVTIVGNAIIMSCRECFAQNGFGVKLVARGGAYVCDHNSSHRYVIERGFTKRI